MTVYELAGVLPYDKIFILKDPMENTIWEGDHSEMDDDEFAFNDRTVGIIHDFDYEEMIIYLEQE